MILTVVVPTIPGRESLLSRCLFSLTEQAPDTVEILVVDGPGLQGDKVNFAATAATGEWMATVDDDDYVIGTYCADILAVLADGPDFVGFRFVELEQHRFSRSTALRGDLNRWGSRQRGPAPKGVTRTSIWRQVRFGNDYFADRRWLAAVYPLIRSHRFIDRHLYVYDHNGDYGDSRDVGVWPFDESRVIRVSPP